VEDHLRQAVVGVERLGRADGEHAALDPRVGVRGAIDTQAHAGGETEPDLVEGIAVGERAHAPKLLQRCAASQLRASARSPAASGPAAANARTAPSTSSRAFARSRPSAQLAWATWKSARATSTGRPAFSAIARARS